MGSKDVNWFHLAVDIFHVWTFITSLMKAGVLLNDYHPLVFQKGGCFLTFELLPPFQQKVFLHRAVRLRADGTRLNATWRTHIYLSCM